MKIESSPEFKLGGQTGVQMNILSGICCRLEGTGQDSNKFCIRHLRTNGAHGRAPGAVLGAGGERRGRVADHGLPERQRHPGPALRARSLPSSQVHRMAHVHGCKCMTP